MLLARIRSIVVDAHPAAPIHISPLPSPLVSNNAAMSGFVKSSIEEMPFSSAKPVGTQTEVKP